MGGSAGDAGFAIAVDCHDAAYLTGRTSSDDYPTTPGAFAPALGGDVDALVTKLDPGGSELAYSTLLGGGGLDGGAGVAVDRNGTAFVTGVTSSPDYPTTLAALDPSFNGVTDAFVTAVNTDGSSLVFSTLLGGSGRGVYVAGETLSVDFPTTPGAFGESAGGGRDGFVTELDLDDGDDD